MAIDVEKIKKRKNDLKSREASKKNVAIKRHLRREYFRDKRKRERLMDGEYHIVKKEEEASKLEQQKEINEFLNKKKEANKKKEVELKAKKRRKRQKYDKYIVSTFWKKRRKLLLEAIGYSCEICKLGHGLHVHHNNYKTRGDEQDCDLTVLCEGCHGMFHKDSKVAAGRRVKPQDMRCRVCAKTAHIEVVKEPRDVKLCESCFQIYFKKLHKVYGRSMYTNKEEFSIRFLL